MQAFKKTLVIFSILLLLMPFVSSISFYDDLNMRTKNIYNATNITATLFLGNGSLLTGVSTSTSITSDLDMNGFDVFNATEINVTTLNLGNATSIANMTVTGNDLDISAIGSVTIQDKNVCLQDKTGCFSGVSVDDNTSFVVNLSNSTTSLVNLYKYSTGTTGPTFNFNKYGNTSSSTGRVLIATELAVLGFRGFDGSSIQRSSMIYVVTTQNWNTTARGSKIQFYTTTNDATTNVVAMTINHNGMVGIGTSSSATNPIYKLMVDGTSWLNGTIKTTLVNTSAETKSHACLDASGNLYRGNASGCY